MLDKQQEDGLKKILELLVEPCVRSTAPRTAALASSQRLRTRKEAVLLQPTQFWTPRAPAAAMRTLVANQLPYLVWH